MNRIFKLLSFAFLSLLLYTCKVPDNFIPANTVTNYLVVEGLINITDSTFINLSRSVNLSAKATTKPELKATVSIESNQGSSYPLKELGNGAYATAPLNLSAANQYRLRIKTSDGNIYASDFTPVVISPPIDSISWAPTATTLNIYANTHDPNNATRYYRWDFDEAWEFHSIFFSDVISDGLQLHIRLPAEYTNVCYTGDNSTLISLGTSANLSRDVINGALVNTIASDAEKISVKYTIGLRQYALTKEAYDYWTLLKKNTESLGSIFDSQPSASIGNIHNVSNPTDIIIGYISAGTVSKQRLFIKKTQLPQWQAPIVVCAVDTTVMDPPAGPPPAGKKTWNQYLNYKSPYFLGTLLIPVSYIIDQGSGKILGVVDAAPFCVDCTLRGKTTPPAYWK